MYWKRWRWRLRASTCPRPQFFRAATCANKHPVLQMKQKFGKHGCLPITTADLCFCERIGSARSAARVHYYSNSGCVHLTLGLDTTPSKLCTCRTRALTVSRCPSFWQCRKVQVFQGSRNNNNPHRHHPSAQDHACLTTTENTFNALLLPRFASLDLAAAQNLGARRHDQQYHRS